MPCTVASDAAGSGQDSPFIFIFEPSLLRGVVRHTSTGHIAMSYKLHYTILSIMPQELPLVNDAAQVRRQRAALS